MIARKLLVLTALSGVITLMASLGLATTDSQLKTEWRNLSFGGFFSTLVSERNVSVQSAVAYGANPRQRLDIYRPEVDEKQTPIVIFYYGGGWTGGDKATYRFVGSAFAAHGITTVIPDYRLFPEVMFPGFVDDAAQAYAWVGQHLATQDRPIIIIGHSAGAHIAALLALDTSYIENTVCGIQRPSALVGLAGPYAFDPTTWPSTRQIFASALSTADKARPIAFAHTGAPAALLLHGDDDDTVKIWNSRDLAKALHQTNNQVELREFAGIGHVGLILAIARPLRWRAPVLETILKFIGKTAAPLLPISSVTCDGRR